MINEIDKALLRELISDNDFAKILETLADLSYNEGDKISMSNQQKSRYYYHLAVSLEPAIKSAIERGL